MQGVWVKVRIQSWSPNNFVTKPGSKDEKNVTHHADKMRVAQWSIRCGRRHKGANAGQVRRHAVPCVISQHHWIQWVANETSKVGRHRLRWTLMTLYRRGEAEMAENERVVWALNPQGSRTCRLLLQVWESKGNHAQF